METDDVEQELLSVEAELEEVQGKNKVLFWVARSGKGLRWMGQGFPCAFVTIPAFFLVQRLKRVLYLRELL
ncbi:hypothetical protein Taro_008076 [Colocasia esculenta]|uniref:Uncharacterized protein n=1 Tax=Colocasia esculenta TaxID=4460 RepID=A0A843U2A4_COLES|nr:hypothetical protein [Colocasia esculenta]